MTNSSLNRHLHDVLISLNQLVTHLGQGLERHPGLFARRHHGEVHALLTISNAVANGWKPAGITALLSAWRACRQKALAHSGADATFRLSMASILHGAPIPTINDELIPWLMTSLSADPQFFDTTQRLLGVVATRVQLCSNRKKGDKSLSTLLRLGGEKIRSHPYRRRASAPAGSARCAG